MSFNNYSNIEYQNIISDRIMIPLNEYDVISFFFNSFIINMNKKLYLSKVSAKTAELIKLQTNDNVYNYNISIKSDIIKKIMKSHGDMINEYLRGQINVTIDDFLLIKDIIDDPDSILLSNKKTKEGKNVLIFKKIIDNLIIVVINISSKHHNLEIQTMYKIKRTLPL